LSNVHLFKFDSEKKVLRVNTFKIDNKPLLDKILQEFELNSIDPKSVIIDGLELQNINNCNIFLKYNLWENIDKYFPYLTKLKIENFPFSNNNLPPHIPLPNLTHLILMVNLNEKTNLHDYIISFFAKCAQNIIIVELYNFTISMNIYAEFKLASKLVLHCCILSLDFSNLNMQSNLLNSLHFQQDTNDALILEFFLGNLNNMTIVYCHDCENYQTIAKIAQEYNVTVFQSFEIFKCAL